MLKIKVFRHKTALVVSADIYLLYKVTSIPDTSYIAKTAQTFAVAMSDTSIEAALISHPSEVHIEIIHIAITMRVSTRNLTYVISIDK